MSRCTGTYDSDVARTATLLDHSAFEMASKRWCRRLLIRSCTTMYVTKTGAGRGRDSRQAWLIVWLLWVRDPARLILPGYDDIHNVLTTQARYQEGVQTMLEQYFNGEAFEESNYIVREGELASQYQ